jgi:hypothetical protein
MTGPILTKIDKARSVHAGQGMRRMGKEFCDLRKGRAIHVTRLQEALQKLDRRFCVA